MTDLMTDGRPAGARRGAGKAKLHRPQLVQGAAARLRDLVFEGEPGARLGSLTEIAQALGVGIVTVQQAARILEHEGLLEVRRGPGGGYYGARPDEAALERSIAAYMRLHDTAYAEARDMMSVLGCELAPDAARCTDPVQREALRALLSRIDAADAEEERLSLEQDLQHQLVRMVDRPFMALLTRVTISLYRNKPGPPILTSEGEIRTWKANRRRLIQAILDGDQDLARFEAVRNRDHLAEIKRIQEAGRAAG